MDYSTFKEVGIVGALMLLFGKVYQKKDEQQNTQNDLLVQNLIDSNKALTEKFDLIIQELRISNAEFVKSTTYNTKILEEIRENKEALRELAKLIETKFN